MRTTGQSIAGNVGPVTDGSRPEQDVAQNSRLCLGGTIFVQFGKSRCEENTPSDVHILDLDASGRLRIREPRWR